MLAAVGMNFRGLLFLAASLAFAGPAMAQNFTYPQGVYNGAKPELGTLPNGGVVSTALLGRMLQTQPAEPYTVELTKGVWALVGYHWGYTALIEGETSLILYDAADDVEEGREIIELAKKVSDKPIRTIIYSHSHYVWGAQAIADAYGDDITVIGDPGINKSLLESGGLGSSIPELAPVLLARTLEQFSFLCRKAARMRVHRRRSARPRGSFRSTRRSRTVNRSPSMASRWFSTPVTKVTRPTM